MSSILKALRKLEEEKAALGEGGVDIARDILKRSAGRTHRSLFWPLTAAILFVLLLGVGIFFGVQLYRSPEPVTPTPDLASAPEPAVTIPVAPAATKEPPVVEEQKPNDEKSVTSVATVPVKHQVVRPVAIVKPPVLPVATRADGLPFLKLTGIAFRKNATERIAIINDLPVMQGTAIEGAQVMEILPDRVILQWQGRRFELRVESD